MEEGRLVKLKALEGRWSILKRAISGKKRELGSVESIHHFNGFSVSRIKKIPFIFELKVTIQCAADLTKFYDDCYNFLQASMSSECKCILNISENIEDCISVVSTLSEFDINDESFSIRVQAITDISSDMKRVELYVLRHSISHANKCDYEYFQYLFCGHLVLKTRERPRNAAISKAGLLSHHLFGIDNTGNICTWPSESILLHALVNNELLKSLVSGKDILEVGAGMCGLCGLGLAVSGIAKTVTITDGHPECVENERVCIQMCKQMYPEICISANLLRWSSLEDISNLTEEATRLFDVVVCADCLFFENFHDNLLNVLCSSTHPSGQVILMQPSRAGSLQRFLDKAVSFFTFERLESYDEQVSLMRSTYAENCIELGYNEDIHYPILIIMTRTGATSACTDETNRV